MNINFGLSVSTGFACTTVLVMNDYPWWGILLLVITSSIRSDDTKITATPSHPAHPEAEPDPPGRS